MKRFSSEDKLAGNNPVAAISRIHKFIPVLAFCLVMEYFIASSMKLCFNKYYLLAFAAAVSIFLFVFFLVRQSEYFEKNLSLLQYHALVFINYFFCLSLAFLLVYPVIILKERAEAVPDEQLKLDMQKIRVATIPETDLDYIRQGIFDTTRRELIRGLSGFSKESKDSVVYEINTSPYLRDFTLQENEKRETDLDGNALPDPIYQFIETRPQTFFDSLKKEQSDLFNYYGFQQMYQHAKVTDDLNYRKDAHKYMSSLASDYTNLVNNRDTYFFSITLVIAILYVFCFLFPAITVTTLFSKKRMISTLTSIAYIFLCTLLILLLDNSLGDKFGPVAYTCFGAVLLVMVVSKYKKLQVAFMVSVQFFYQFILAAVFLFLILLSLDWNFLREMPFKYILLVLALFNISVVAILNIPAVQLYRRFLHYPSN